MYNRSIKDHRDENCVKTFLRSCPQCGDFVLDRIWTSNTQPWVHHIKFGHLVHPQIKYDF